MCVCIYLYLCVCVCVRSTRVPGVHGGQDRVSDPVKLMPVSRCGVQGIKLNPDLVEQPVLLVTETSLHPQLVFK